MPKATSGGASNAWEQPDGDVFEMSAAWEAEAPPAPEEPAAEPAVEEPAAADPVTVEEPASVEDVAAPKASARTRKA